MGKKHIAALLSILLLVGIFSACSAKTIKLNPKSPLTLTLWHNYGGQMQSTMDMLVDEFNMTIGREKGIIISVTAVSSMKEQEERVAMIATGDPGAETLPDILTAYPKTAMLLAKQGMLAALDENFTDEELTSYVPQFIEEGRLSDGKLYVFPIAKSSEMLFVNQTLFDRFSAATGVSLDSLSTFEGIAAAARKYYEWTDSLTPEVAQDGKAFYTADSWFNIAQVGVAQLGATFVTPEALAMDSPQYDRVWEFAMHPALSGGYAVIDGYSSDLSKTGDIVCSTGSTAGILFYGERITYPDNSSEEATYSILPYPVFEGGEKIALQRGAGMVVTSTTPEKEYAAALFLKWFTHPKQNVRFVSSTGYLPVTNEAYSEILAQRIEPAENANIQKMLETSAKVHQEYAFITMPNYDGVDTISKQYETELKAAMRSGRQRVLAGEAVQDVTVDLRESFMR